MRISDTSSHIEFIVILDSPKFSVVVSSNPLDVGVNMNPFLTNSDLLGNSFSPVEVVLTIYEEDLIFCGLDHLMTFGVYDIGWINEVSFGSNRDSSHPQSVITINSPRH